VTKKLAGDFSEWKMVKEVVFMVIRGDGSRLCHGNDVLAKGSEEAR
jgi:hypothetical protein